MAGAGSHWHIAPGQRTAALSRPEFPRRPYCPEMVLVPAGRFVMGSANGEPGRSVDEGPQVPVALFEPFAVGKFEVTFVEWDTCVAEGGCTHRPDDKGLGT
jgi:formylglycine-generating enzyme required for sulfatase activity